MEALLYIIAGMVLLFLERSSLRGSIILENWLRIIAGGLFIQIGLVLIANPSLNWVIDLVTITTALVMFSIAIQFHKKNKKSG
ncbi:hypothetical protein GW793_00920 [bacterium]|uniref:Uncharacterized protein n=2 Tax=Katanobacteria TaxID=422282 RepID=A0A2M7X1B8_UNCKA|nr:hypothetical protein [bacterium]PIP56846.1 MAG: hypothetical protein COX05_00925 [candidate division WWE3 bacterium CG22_combo_CG10-13_8_21_14_all_39_12]PJA39963.1 MAG: hypothetical protein CO179_03820 [candidate division WWE3 bacterium CG_4_9_14_3_um_filter_39_7]